MWAYITCYLQGKNSLSRDFASRCLLISFDFCSRSPAWKNKRALLYGPMTYGYGIDDIDAESKAMCPWDAQSAEAAILWAQL